MRTWCYAKSLTKNKSLEIELSDNPWNWFHFAVDWTRNTDHAGFKFTLAIYRAEFTITIYDNRHWNYDENKWEIYLI